MVESQLISDLNPHMPKPLELEKSMLFFNELKITKCKHCNTPFSKDDPIIHYQHPSGWIVPGYEKKQWLFIVCPNPKCQFQWALWKLGVGKSLLPIQHNSILQEDIQNLCVEKTELQSKFEKIKILIKNRLKKLAQYDPYWKVDYIPEEMLKRQPEIDNLNEILKIIKSD